jgi:hypothetical protein
VVPRRTFRAMHSAVRPGMTRLEALRTLADVRAQAGFQTIFLPDQGPSPEVQPLFWTFGRRPSASEVEELDTKLASARQFRVIAAAPFSHMEFALTVSDDGRVETVGERSGSAK